MTALLVVLGGAIGAPTRALVDQWVSRRAGTALPWGTVAVNAVGSLILGFVAAATLRNPSAGADHLLTLVGTGFCGALTTFSTLSVATLKPLLEGRRTTAAATAAVSLTTGIAAICAGWWLGSL